MSPSDQEDDINRTNLPNNMLIWMRNKELQNSLNSNQSDFFPSDFKQKNCKILNVLYFYLKCFHWEKLLNSYLFIY